MQKKKSGVKKCLEICAIKGGGVGRLMANAILNFHFDYLKPSLTENAGILRGQAISKYNADIQYIQWYAIKGGTTCGAIDEASRSLKAIDQCVIINVCDKNYDMS